ncbi:Uncharacterized protein dnm_048990 [Desulfonema magnum]|uniref:Uncharacterized protein n=1 Tax=Desulfonema magnum TaxID=45655 RepID=A0A975BNL6_9BACT|nr:Uncharacterized protein dnm_048990 [Desulfonema magnum]
MKRIFRLSREHLLRIRRNTGREYPFNPGIRCHIAGPPKSVIIRLY